MTNFKFEEQQHVTLKDNKKSTFVQRLVNLVVYSSGDRLNKKQAGYVLLVGLIVLLLSFNLFVNNNESKYNNIKLQDNQLSPKFDHEK